MRILWEKTKNGYNIFKCQDFPAQLQTLWAAEKDSIAAYGTSLTGAIRNLDFKLLKDLPVDEHPGLHHSNGLQCDYRNGSPVNRPVLEPKTRELERKMDGGRSHKVNRGRIRLRGFYQSIKKSGCIS